jgi:DNA-binding PadR family transcriptional regulator
MPPPDRKVLTREILLGFWKVHILHHAAQEPVVGQWILAELRRHGYDVSPGTLYPLLRRMERNGWLAGRRDTAAGRRGRRYYHLTAGGADVLRFLRDIVTELHHEVVEEAAVYDRPRRTGTRGTAAPREQPSRTVSPSRPRRSPPVRRPRARR